MLTFLFWNINKRPLVDLITTLISEYKVDVLILAETEVPDIDILKSAKSKGCGTFTIAPPGLPGAVKIYSRLSHRFLKPVKDYRGVAIRRIMPPVGSDVTLVAVHLPSKIHETKEDQIFNCMRLARRIENVEDDAGHTRTLIIGDLNMNPFECGMVGADGIHGVMDRKIAAKGMRVVKGENRQFFYNPMWSYFGDVPPGPPGTYFYNKGGQVNMYWNMFDQILIRPELLDAFSHQNLRILTEVGPNSLLTKSGRPNKNYGSDHLPVLLSLKL